jgi:hypothetical protein
MANRIAAAFAIGLFLAAVYGLLPLITQLMNR